MAESMKKIKTYQFNNPMETFPGLTIDDLNKYLPAIQTVEDMPMNNESMKDGLYLTKCVDGLRRLPDSSIDLIIATPPKDNWDTTLDSGQGNTLQEYYQWNKAWLNESYRVLKKTGAIYVFCPWQYSGMYQGLLTNLFFVQTRITWKNRNYNDESKTWVNETSDIWFVTKTDEFLFKQSPMGINTVQDLETNEIESNLWIDIPINLDEGAYYPQKLFSRILDASSFKLNWVLNPFSGLGDVGVACKKNGRRFIGFETNKDYLLLSMKRIDNS